MKKGYKATYGMKCESLTYEVGKTYQSSLLEMCKHGFHYCENIEDTEQYYDFNNETLKIIEIEILGEVVTGCNKSVSDKIKVLRVVPAAEYQHLLTQKEYDSNGNPTKRVYPDGRVHLYEYDSNGNKTKEVYHNEGAYLYDYDSNGNKTKEVYPYGVVWELTIS